MKNMIKQFATLLFLVALTSGTVVAQPDIEWEKSYGGSGADGGNSVKQTPDGGYIIAGFSSSSDGDVGGNNGRSDCWVIKLDNLGNIQWEENYGGSSGDGSDEIQPTSDGGYVMLGYIQSTDIPGHHGFLDWWVLKLDHIGNVQWQRTLGGSYTDIPNSIQETTDGGFIIAGSTASVDGDVVGFHPNPDNPNFSDAWIVKLDNSGNIEWQRTIGGTGTESAQCVRQTSDGGYIMTGGASSNDGDLDTLSLLGRNLWIVKFAGSGNMIWQKLYGGIQLDLGHSISETSDGKYIIAGITYSDNGDVSGNHDQKDFWILKVDSNGDIIWQNAIGGSDNEYEPSIQETLDGGFIFTGYSYSNDGDIIGNHGVNDMIAGKLDVNGNLVWLKTMGGSGSDYSKSIQQTFDGGFILTGGSNSNDGDVTSTPGSEGVWVVKLKCPLVLTCQTDLTVASDPGICGASVAFNAPSESGNCAGVGVNQTAGPESGSVFPVGTTTVSFLATDATGSTASCSFTVTVTSDLTADAGSDQVVIIDNGPGPDPYPCDTLEASASGGTPPYTYGWAPTEGLSVPNAATTDVCPTVTTTYTLTVTDANGCESTDEVTVTVIDIDNTGSLPLVGNNSNKVYVCHLATCETVEANIQANCNSPHSLCAHLSHGDVLGECTCKNGSGEGESHVHDWTSQLNAYPNPFTNTTTLTFRVEQDCRATLSVFDITGKEVARPFDGAAKKEKLHIATLDGSNLGSGIYLYTLQTDYRESFTRKLVLSR